MSKKLKRKLSDENRIFNSDWELQYYIVPEKDKMVCLLYNSTITTLKKYNANQHYETHKDHKYTKLEDEARKAALNKLKKEHLCQKQMFSNFIKQGTIATDVTYKIAYILGKRGKPFSDVEMIKECIVEAVGSLDPRKVEKYKQLPLSRRTITERQHELAQNVTEELRSIIQNKTVYFSLALDESTDATDSAQVLFFIRAITDDFCCFEELLALGTLPGRTRGIDIYNNFKEKCFEAGLNLDNLVSVCTDGAPSMKGKREGFISLLKKDNPSLGNLISFHCILHQQNLCAKSATLNSTLDKVVKIVNFIRASATRHRQFRNILMSESNDEIYSVDLPYHSKIRWLSSGHVLVRILSLRKEILQFYEEQQQHCELLEEGFCRNVAFLCDIMVKQNELNVVLQGRTKHIYDMWQKIQAFRKKLLFFKTLFSQSQISEEHFPELTKVINEQEYVGETFQEYIAVLDSLIEEYSDRFSDFEEHTLAMKLAYEPHLLDISTAPSELQMELFELCEDNIIKNKFDSKQDPIEIWKTAIEYPKLRQHARKLLSCFGTTYCCESTFSYLTQIKTPLRTRITDTHLEDLLKLRVTKLNPNFQLLSNKKQTQKSH